MKLSDIPEFRAQANAQQDIQEEKSLKEEIVQLRNELKDMKVLLESLLEQKASK